MTTTSNKITAIYCRLSREDEQKSDLSNSIKNQKTLLENHAKTLGLENIEFFIDDGISGVFQETRPAFNDVMDLISKNCVSALIVKDLSRAGRNITKLVSLQKQFYLIMVFDLSHSVTESTNVTP